MSDGANIMFEAARARCYIQKKPAQPQAIDVDASTTEDAFDTEWDVLDEIEGRTPAPKRPIAPQEAEGWKPWMPSGMEPILEELPKWKILVEVLTEIEETIANYPAPFCESLTACRPPQGLIRLNSCAWK